MYPAEDGLYVGFKERGGGVEEEMIAIPLDSEMNRMNVWGPPMGKIVKHLNRYLNNGSCSLFHSLE